MSPTSRVLTALLLAASLTRTAPAGADGESLQRSLADVRRATAAYHQVGNALTDGYVATDVCVPGMGLHYVNPQHLSNPMLDPTKPDVLIYEPRPGGRLSLVAVEWFFPDPDQNLATDDGRPALFGTPFDGPMAGHEPGMPVHFDLHLWAWKHNPAGTLTASNPTVTCPT